MLIPNHPEEERLSALASLDPAATADGALTDHVAGCVRCTDTVAELGALRAALADLPDLKPSRPLVLLPAVESGSTSADPLGGWARRLFAPFVMAGATLAFVGLVGTSLSALGGMAASGAAPLGAGAEQAASEPAAQQPAAGGAEAAASDDQTRGFTDGASAPADQVEEPAPSAETDALTSGEGDDRTVSRAAVERSIWPMLLFAGIALIIGALLMRWILAPRAG